MQQFAKVIVNGPFYEPLDYLIPENLSVKIGSRVIVPLRNRKTIGFILNIVNKSQFKINQLKNIIEILDEKPILTKEEIDLTLWLSQYYHSFLYDALSSILPNALLHGESLTKIETFWQINPNFKSINLDDLFKKNAIKQRDAFQFLQNLNKPITQEILKEKNIDLKTLRNLESKHLISYSEQKINLFNENIKIDLKQLKIEKPKFKLSDEQLLAIETVKESANQFHCFLLNGVTGSGKTEVYLKIIEKALKNNQQILVLVPEIGLTPQLIERFKVRFNDQNNHLIETFHSFLSDKKRFEIWHLVKQEQVKIIIGTRSAVFLPFKNLGFIVVDEEHDASFKQQVRLRYNARDIAILRAKKFNIPIVLGSATPSLETLYQVKNKKYQELLLSKRSSDASECKTYLIDMRHNAIHSGISQQLMDKISEHLANHNQVMLFLNRRGYAPILSCESCGDVVECKRCDSPFTYHINPQRLICHFCQSSKPILSNCPSCQSDQLKLMGHGTEKLEEYLIKQFPHHHILRIDRTSTNTQAKIEDSFEQIKNKKVDIIIGTQMLAKGHHFPNVTLVGIINIDQGLFSVDFRALERTAQLITQVSGRAGREEKKGEVYLQTRQVDHPLLQLLLKEGYLKFAEQILEERKELHFPPISSIALLNGESSNQVILEQLLIELRNHSQALCQNNQKIIGPFPALRAKTQGKYKMTLLIQANNRAQRQQILYQIRQLILDKKYQKVRLSLDIDPSDLM